MNMKKWLALLLACVTAFAIIGCKDTGGDPNTPIDIGPAVSPTPAPGDDPAAQGLGLAQAAAPIGMIAAGNVHSAGLRVDGTAVSAGHDTVGQRKVSNWENVAFIAAGETVTAGVTTTGTLLLAGDGTAFADSASWDAAAAWTGLHSVAIGRAHIAGLKTDGTVVAAGNTADGQCDVSAWKDIVAVAAGDAFTVGLTSAGTLVTAGKAPDVSAWKDVVAISAGGDAVAALTNTGAALATGADVSAWSGLVAIGAGAFGVVGVKADGTVVAALSDATVDLSAETDIVSVAVGTGHVVLMHRDGTATAHGANEDLQCMVDRFFLRPYREPIGSGETTSYYLIGFRPGMTVAEATPILKALTASETASFTKEDGSAAADTDLIASGLVANSADSTPFGTVVLMGDVNCDGAINDADVQAILGYIENNASLSATALRASLACADTDWNKVYSFTSTLGTNQGTYSTAATANRTLAGATIIDKYAKGEGKLSQYGDWHRSNLTEGYEISYAQNSDTVGYIKIDGTNIDYPIMYKQGDQWYYNGHTFEKKEAESGSLYPYFSVYGKNNVVTGHNSRPSGSMFHQLHHLQEFNLGETSCLHKKNCGKELVNLPDFHVYANRVWSVLVHGVEARYEIFAMYETKAPADAESQWYNNVWWGKHKHTTDAEVQEWINKQLGLTEFDFDTTVTVEDTFMTVFTCANEHADAAKNARLFYFLKRVD